MSTPTIDDLINPATPDQWMAKFLSIAASLNLPVTDWSEGGVTRTVYATLAEAVGVSAGSATNTAGATVDGIVCNIAKGGFLDYAATITPDPSVPNADGTYPTGGWLDLCGIFVFNAPRNQATQGVSTVALGNASASTYGPFAAGTYHLFDSVTGATFSNASSLTIPPGGVTGATFNSDAVGPAGNGTPNSITTSLFGVTISTATTATGAPAESNANYVTRLRLKWAILAAKTGPTSAFQYFAISPQEAGYPSLASPITRAKVVTDPTSCAVTVYLANSSGAPSGGDVSAMQTYLQNTCTSDVEIMTCAAASNQTVTLALTVYAPADPTAQVQAAYLAFLAALQIGGDAMEDIGGNGVPIGEVIDAIARSGPITIRTQTGVQLGGVATSYALTSTQVAVANSGNITVTYGGT